MYLQNCQSCTKFSSAIMYRSRGYLQYFTILLVLSLYLIEEVSSRKCYACHSDLNPNCTSNAKQEKFAVQCSPGRSMFNSTLNNEDILKAKALEYDCAYAKGISTADGRDIVIRGCAFKKVTCDTYKYVYAVGDAMGHGFQVESCGRCDSDLCNASGHLSTGIWSLSLSLLALYLIKF